MKEAKLHVLISQTLSRDAVVVTDDFQPEEPSGIPGEAYDTSETDWENAYKDNRHYTPEQLINLFRMHLREEMIRLGSTIDKSRYQHLINECSDWLVDETVYMEN
jgi:hypothetical protein